MLNISCVCLKLNRIVSFLNEFYGAIDPQILIQYGGLLIIFLAVYAQTGLFFCFFIPSGIFLFTGGVFVATGQLQHHLITVCSSLILASILGCITGYLFGRETGPLLYKRKDSRFFKQKHLKAAEVFYKKYGELALTIGLLFPVIRTFAPIIAGMIRMNFNRFCLLIFIGSALWISIFVLSGYLIGSIPALKEYLPYIITGIILTVTIPVVTRIIREFKKAGDEKEKKS